MLVSIRLPWRVLLKYRFLTKTEMAKTLLVSDSEGFGCSPQICVSNQFPDDTDAAGLGTTL